MGKKGCVKSGLVVFLKKQAEAGIVLRRIDKNPLHLEAKKDFLGQEYLFGVESVSKFTMYIASTIKKIIDNQRITRCTECSQ